MKVVFHEDFLREYTIDPAAASGRLEAVADKLRGRHRFLEAVAASEEDIAAVHSAYHIDEVRRIGLYDIAALAAGGAAQAAEIGLKEPCFALIRPPGHHASADSSWGFCYFNNMAVALKRLKNAGEIKTALVLDIDLHFGDGTVNILGSSGYTEVFNPMSADAREYLKSIEAVLSNRKVDLIGISAGFDNAKEDWGGLLSIADYLEIGKMVRAAAQETGAGYFAILEGGYNHRVLGENASALLDGMEK